MFLTEKRLWSLWDMLRISADEFHKAVHMLAMYRCFIEAQEEDLPIVGTTPPKMTQLLREFAPIVEGLELDATKTALDAIYDGLSGPRPAIDGQMRFATIHVYRTMNDELKRVRFFAIKRDAVKFYEQNEPPFGQEVYDKLPDAISDISEAGKCLALDRTSACVYHLMCAMDVALQAFCAKLGVTFDPSWDWQKTLDETLKKINAMPKNTAQEMEAKERYLGAHADLHAVRRAWRNPSMHARLQVNEERAVEIYNAVKGFMRHLATEIM